MSALYLSSAAKRVKVEPLVHFAILDHYLRRNKDQSRVIGTLLGSVKGGVIEITNCYPVPHIENEDKVAVDTPFHDSMLYLHQRVNMKEDVVGWYATGSEITEYSNVIHDFYKRTSEGDAVHLLIDPAMSNGSMDVKAFISKPMGVPNGVVGSTFVPLQCDVQYHEPERIGLELMTKGLTSTTNTTALASDLAHVKKSTDALQRMLTTCSEYVNKVVSGEIQGDEKVGRYLLDTISAVPKVDAAQFEKTFNNVLQDLLMVVYLANLTRSQVILQEKISEIL